MPGCLSSAGASSCLPQCGGRESPLAIPSVGVATPVGQREGRPLPSGMSARRASGHMTTYRRMAGVTPGTEWLPTSIGGMRRPVALLGRLPDDDSGADQDFGPIAMPRRPERWGIAMSEGMNSQPISARFDTGLVAPLPLGARRAYVQKILSRSSRPWDTRPRPGYASGTVVRRAPRSPPGGGAAGRLPAYRGVSRGSRLRSPVRRLERLGQGRWAQVG
jgi:hypothetical protein